MIVKSATRLPSVAIVGLCLVGCIANPWHKVLLASARCMIGNLWPLKFLHILCLRQLNFQKWAHCRYKLEIWSLLNPRLLINRWSDRLHSLAWFSSAQRSHCCGLLLHGGWSMASLLTGRPFFWLWLFLVRRRHLMIIIYIKSKDKLTPLMLELIWLSQRSRRPFAHGWAPLEAAPFWCHRWVG